MRYPWLREEEYLKRQLHVALAFVSVLCMMSASRVSAASHVHFSKKENPPPNDMEMQNSTSEEEKGGQIQQCKVILAELSLSMVRHQSRR